MEPQCELAVRAAIVAASTVYYEPAFREWARLWICGLDRSARAADAAAGEVRRAASVPASAQRLRADVADALVSIGLDCREALEIELQWYEQFTPDDSIIAHAPDAQWFEFAAQAAYLAAQAAACARSEAVSMLFDFAESACIRAADAAKLRCRARRRLNGSSAASHLSRNASPNTPNRRGR